MTYFIYVFVLCLTSTLLIPAHTYVVLTANPDDFRSLAKKLVPKNLVDQVKEIVIENNHKYNRETSKDDKDRESQQDDSNDAQQPVNKYHVIGALKATPATSSVLTLDDIVKLVKKKLLQELIAKTSNAQASKNVHKGQVESPIFKPDPVKVLKEEVLFEGTYEDTNDDDVESQTHYQGLVVQGATKYLNRKPVTDTSHTKGEAVKKMRYVKQVVVPANSDQGQPLYQSQPSLGQHVSIMQTSNLEPQLSLSQQSTILQKLASMQKQIDRLNQIIEQKVLKKKRIVQPTTQTVLEAPHSTTEADEEKTKESEESELSAETTIDPAVTEPSTKALTVPSTVKSKQSNEHKETTGKVENEQLSEDNELIKDITGTGDNDNVAVQVTTPEEMTENNSKDEEETTSDKTPESGEGTVQNDSRLDANSKVYTKEFGTPDVGMPIVEKTYNFNAPMDKVPDSSSLPVDSARKVMLL